MGMVAEAATPLALAVEVGVEKAQRLLAEEVAAFNLPLAMVEVVLSLLLGRRLAAVHLVVWEARALAHPSTTTVVGVLNFFWRQ
jgi:hypothetical protein